MKKRILVVTILSILLTLSLVVGNVGVQTNSFYDIEVENHTRNQPNDQTGPPVIGGDQFFLISENAGQMSDIHYPFYIKGDGMSVFFDTSSIHVALSDSLDESSTNGYSFSIEFKNSKPVAPTGFDPTDHRTNYYRGKDGWITDVRSYRGLVYHDLYDGIDLKFKVGEKVLKYEFTIWPNGDPKDIKMEYKGIEGIELETGTGDLMIETGISTLRDPHPVAFQDPPSGRRIIFTHYRLHPGSIIGFEVDDYDESIPLVIDPEINFTKRFGGQRHEYALSVVIDQSGSIYVAGTTESNDFVVTDDAISKVRAGRNDMFLCKFSPDGEQLLYSTLIGGINQEYPLALAHRDGDVYIVGDTNSSDFPTTSDAVQEIYGDEYDGFLLKLNASGQLEYSTFLGGAGNDEVNGIDLDRGCNIYITGTTSSDDFPVKDGSFDVSFNGGTDAFIMKFNCNLTSLVYSTYIGGTAKESGMNVCVDEYGNAFVGGSSKSSRGFPVTSGAFDVSCEDYDGFILKLNPTGTSLSYATFLGGSGDDSVFDIAIDEIGHVYATGRCRSDFPTTIGAYYSPPNQYDIHVTKLSPNGDRLEFSTAIGSGPGTFPLSICVDGSGKIYIAGYTEYVDFPTKGDGYVEEKNSTSWYDIFLSQVNKDGSDLLYSTCYGKWYDDIASGLTLGYRGNAIVVGHESYTGRKQALILSFDGFDSQSPVIHDDHTPETAFTGDPFTFNVSLTDDFGVSNASIEFWQGSSIIHQNISISLSEGNIRTGEWTSSTDMPSDDLRDLHYIIHVTDNTGKSNASIEKIVPVKDRIRPNTNDNSDESPSTGDEFIFRLDAVDNFGIEAVHVVYWYGSRLYEKQNVSMNAISTTGQGNGSYEHVLHIPTNANEPLSYQFVVSDIHNNWNLSATIKLQVIDNDLPTIEPDMSMEKVSTGDPVAFKVICFDNVRLSLVNVVFWYGENDESVFNETMQTTGGGIYRFSDHLVPLTSLDPLHYSFVAIDASGNVNTTDPVQIPVVDLLPPAIIEDLSDTTATTGEVFQVRVRVEDNIGVESVSFEYWYGDPSDSSIKDMDEGSSGEWSLLITLPSDSMKLRYTFHVKDVSRNGFTSSERAVTIEDNDPPTLTAWTIPYEAVKGHSFTITARCWDNIQVEGVWAEYWYGDGERTNASMTLGNVYYLSVSIPRLPQGELRYTFHAVDTNGNWNETEEMTESLVNLRPTVEPPDVWEITEEADEVLDLSRYIQDGNDPPERLTLTCLAANVTVEGLELHAMYSTWMPEHVIEVTVSDGDDEVTFDITVRVVNVNDPPELVTIKIGGEEIDLSNRLNEIHEIREGSNVTIWVQVYDEDGDEVEYRWFRGEEEVANGQEVGYADLPKGEYFLTLEVDDGTYTSSYKLPTIRVYGADEGADEMLILVLLITVLLMVVAVVVTLYVLKKKAEPEQ